MNDKMNSSKHTAGIAGVLYLLVGILGGFAEGFVEPKVYVVGDLAATAANVIPNPSLVRIGVVADLLDQTSFVFLALTLYILLKHVNKNVARAMLVLVSLSAAIGCLNAVFEFEGLRVATNSGYVAAFGIEGSHALIFFAGNPALWYPRCADILRPVAGASWVSRLQIGDFPRVAR